MRRVVVTGLGIVSCLGNDRASVAESLRELRSGIREVPEYAELGMRSHVAGAFRAEVVGFRLAADQYGDARMGQVAQAFDPRFVRVGQAFRRRGDLQASHFEETSLSAMAKTIKFVNCLAGELRHRT